MGLYLSVCDSLWSDLGMGGMTKDNCWAIYTESFRAILSGMCFAGSGYWTLNLQNGKGLPVCGLRVQYPEPAKHIPLKIALQLSV
jgi:hypothetical protein